MDKHCCPEASRDVSGSTDFAGLRFDLTQLGTSSKLCSAKAQRRRSGLRLRRCLSPLFVAIRGLIFIVKGANQMGADPAGPDRKAKKINARLMYVIRAHRKGVLFQ